MDFLTILALLIAAHALADYPLQGDFLSRVKSRAAPIDGACPGIRRSALMPSFTALLLGSSPAAFLSVLPRLSVTRSLMIGSAWGG